MHLDPMTQPLYILPIVILCFLICDCVLLAFVTTNRQQEGTQYHAYQHQLILFYWSFSPLLWWTSSVNGPIHTKLLVANNYLLLTTLHKWILVFSLHLLPCEELETLQRSCQLLRCSSWQSWKKNSTMKGQVEYPSHFPSHLPNILLHQAMMFPYKWTFTQDLPHSLSPNTIG